MTHDDHESIDPERLDELASASLDDELAPHERALAADPQVVRRATELAIVARQLRVEVAPPAAACDDAVAAALAAFDASRAGTSTADERPGPGPDLDGDAAIPLRPSSGGPPPPLERIPPAGSPAPPYPEPQVRGKHRFLRGVAAVAAVGLGLVALGALVDRGGDRDVTMAPATAPGLESAELSSDAGDSTDMQQPLGGEARAAVEPGATTVAAASASAAAASGLVLGALGAFDTIDELRDRVLADAGPLLDSTPEDGEEASGGVPSDPPSSGDDGAGPSTTAPACPPPGGTTSVWTAVVDGRPVLAFGGRSASGEPRLIVVDASTCRVLGDLPLS